MQYQLKKITRPAVTSTSMRKVIMGSLCFLLAFLLAANGRAQNELAPVVVTASPLPSPNPFGGITIQCPCDFSIRGGGFNFQMYRWLSTLDFQGQALNAFSVDNLAKQVQNLAANSATKCEAPKFETDKDGSKTLISCSAVFGEIANNKSLSAFDMGGNGLEVKFESGSYKTSIGSNPTGFMGLITPNFQSFSAVTYDYNFNGRIFSVSVNPATGNGTFKIGTTGNPIQFTGAPNPTPGQNQIIFGGTYSLGGTQKVELIGNIGLTDGKPEAIGIQFKATGFNFF